jgi:hypothetical protein
LCGLGLGKSGSDDEVDHMIIDALTSPTKKGAVSSPVDFYTPEKSPDSHWHLPHEIANASADTSNSTTPCPVFSIPWDANIPEGDDNSQQCKFSFISRATQGQIGTTWTWYSFVDHAVTEATESRGSLRIPRNQSVFGLGGF